MEVDNDAPIYYDGLLIRQSGIEDEDVDCLVTKLRRLCKEYKGLSFMLVSSTTKSTKTDNRMSVYTGKAGRPKKIVSGIKVGQHIHCLIISENESVDASLIKKEIAKYMKKRMKKRPNLKQYDTEPVWKDGLPIVKYMSYQADSTHFGGDFDFQYYMEDSYHMNHEEL